jgi:DNA-directed RNA polymerase subunit RPC12/RpoP
MARVCCSRCGEAYYVAAELEGQRIKCRNCGTRIPVLGNELTVPAREPAAPPAAILVAAIPGEQTTRCHDCGERFPERLAVRRQGKVGHSTGSWSGTLFGGSTTTEHFAIVDICPACEQKRQAEAGFQSMAMVCTLVSIAIGIGASFIGGCAVGFFLFLGVFFLSALFLGAMKKR